MEIIANTSPITPAQLTEVTQTGTIVDEGMVSEELMFNRNLTFAVIDRLAAHWEGINDFSNQPCSRSDASPEVLDLWSEH